MYFTVFDSNFITMMKKIFSFSSTFFYQISYCKITQWHNLFARRQSAHGVSMKQFYDASAHMRQYLPYFMKTRGGPITHPLLHYKIYEIKISGSRNTFSFTRTSFKHQLMRWLLHTRRV